jgi:putative acetyltransferase
MSIIIRPENSDDYEAIRSVNSLAFGQNGEARLVDALRDGGYVRCSLIAEKKASTMRFGAPSAT